MEFHLIFENVDYDKPHVSVRPKSGNRKHNNYLNTEN